MGRLYVYISCLSLIFCVHPLLFTFIFDIFTSKNFINPVLLLFISYILIATTFSHLHSTQHLQNALFHLPIRRDRSMCDICVRWLFPNRRALG